MKIIHVLPQFPAVRPGVVIGGYPSAVASLASRQSADGNETVILARLPVDYRYDGPARLIQTGKLSRGRSRLGALRFISAAAVKLLQVSTRDSVIHIHSGYGEYTLLGVLAKAFVKNRVVVHTLYCPKSGGIRGQLQVSIVALARWAGVRLSGMSKHVGASYGDGFTHSPPYIDANHYSAKDELDRGGGDASTPFLFVGNGRPEKGLPDLLEALPEVIALMDPQLLPALRPILTVTTELRSSSSSPATEAAYGRLCELGLMTSVRSLQIIDDMPGLLRSHRIHVAPFRHTNGPSDYFISTLEAMAAGLVCVVSDLPGMSEVVQDGRNGIVHVAGDASSLASALQRALRADLISIGEAARKTVATTFGHDAIEGIYEVYGVESSD